MQILGVTGAVLTVLGLGVLLPVQAASTPLVHWSCDQIADGTVSDSGPHAVTGTIVGSPGHSSDGMVGGSLVFSGNDHLSAAAVGSLVNGFDAITVSMWVATERIGVDQGLFYGGAPNGADALLGLRYDAHGWASGETSLLKASLTTTAGQLAVESFSYQQTAGWTHFALTWESGSTLLIYQNGVPVPLAHQSATALGGTIAGVDEFMIGLGAKGSGWQGHIDDVRIYGTALPSEAIRDLATPSELLYSESFPMPVGPTFVRPVTAAFGWTSQAWYENPNSAAAEHGDRIVGSGSVPDVSNNPLPEPTQDGAFYTSNTSRSILTYTRECAGLDISQVREIRCAVSARADMPLYAAIEIDGQWYASSDPYTVAGTDLLDIGSGPNAFETASFLIRDVLFTDVIVWDTGIIKRGQSDPHALPRNGTVTAIGVFTTKNGSNKYVIDDYQVFGSPVADMGAFATALPVNSQVSPVFLEGSRKVGTEVACTMGSTAVVVNAINDRHFFVDVPLAPSSPTKVTVASGAAQLTRKVIWTTTKVTSDPGLTIRVGDALRLEFPLAVDSFGLANACGPSIDVMAPSEAVVHTHRFTTPGLFSVSYMDAQGVTKQGIQVAVVGVTVPVDRACEFAYNRDLEAVLVEPADISDLVVTWSDGHTSFVASDDDGWKLTPLVRDDVVIAHRLGSNGPILATEAINVFELRTTAEQYLAASDRFEDGTLLITADMHLKPATPALDCRVTIIAAGVTMDDSTLERTYPSDGFSLQGNGEAHQTYGMLMDPLTFSGGPCHRISAWQNDVQVGGE